MVKQLIWATLAIFIVWLMLDFLLHRLLLRSVYEATANLWRPMDQMNIPLVYFVMLVLIVSFVLIYEFLIEPKSLASGVKFGVVPRQNSDLQQTLNFPLYLRYSRPDDPYLTFLHLYTRFHLQTSSRLDPGESRPPPSTGRISTPQSTTATSSTRSPLLGLAF